MRLPSQTSATVPLTTLRFHQQNPSLRTDVSETEDLKLLPVHTLTACTEVLSTRDLLAFPSLSAVKFAKFARWF